MYLFVYIVSAIILAILVLHIVLSNASNTHSIKEWCITEYNTSCTKILCAQSLLKKYSPPTGDMCISLSKHKYYVQNMQFDVQTGHILSL